MSAPTSPSTSSVSALRPTRTTALREAAWRAGVAGTTEALVAAFEHRWPGSLCGPSHRPRVLLDRLDGGPTPVVVTAATIRPVRL